MGYAIQMFKHKCIATLVNYVAINVTQNNKCMQNRTVNYSFIYIIAYLRPIIRE